MIEIGSDVYVIPVSEETVSERGNPLVKGYAPNGVIAVDEGAVSLSPEEEGT